MSLFKRSLAMVLCSLLTGLPAMAQPGGSNQVAGQINALIPAATRNSQTAKVKEELNWNDLLKTEKTSRGRAGLKKTAPILSVGFLKRELRNRAARHCVSQQTELEMDFGKVRSQVTKVTKAGGKEFEMKTPNAVIGVINTDFYTSFEGNKTTVIYFKDGTVTPMQQRCGNCGCFPALPSRFRLVQMVVTSGHASSAPSPAPPRPPGCAPARVCRRRRRRGEAHPRGHLVHNVRSVQDLRWGKLGLGLYFGTRGGNGTCKPGSPNCGQVDLERRSRSVTLDQRGGPKNSRPSY